MEFLAQVETNGGEGDPGPVEGGGEPGTPTVDVVQGLDGWEFVVGASVVLAITILTLYTLFRFFRRIQQGTLMEATLESWIEELRPLPETVAAVIDEFTMRRYEFLTFYGQFILAALVTALIGLLLLAGSVTPEAGIPVLATILGIVFGKAVLSRRALPEQAAQERPPSVGGQGGGGGDAAALGGDGPGEAIADDELDEDIVVEEEVEAVDVEEPLAEEVDAHEPAEPTD